VGSNGPTRKGLFFLRFILKTLIDSYLCIAEGKVRWDRTGDGLPVRHTIFEGLNASNAVANSSVCVYSKIDMTPFLRKLLGLNWLLLVVMLALAVFGVVAIYSATYMREDPVAADFWRKQANWVMVGFFAFMLASLVDYRWIRWGALPMYALGIICLVLTKFIGQKVYGARSWLHLGPLNFQPAQLAVVAGIMVLALFLSQFKTMHPMLRLLVCGAIAGAPCLLILMQPDLGEVIIWVPVLLALLFVGGMPLRYLICILLILFAMIPITANLVLNKRG